jgi:hypothetical protein
MAVIGPRLCFLFGLAAFTTTADQPHDVLQAINQVANGLTSGNPADALGPFDKSLPNYVTLENEFIGLTQSYLITNEVDVLDEEDSAGDTKLTLRWAITLANKESNDSNSHAAEVHVHLQLKNGKWKIIELSPIDIFTP